MLSARSCFKVSRQISFRAISGQAEAGNGSRCVASRRVALGSHPTRCSGPLRSTGLYQLGAWDVTERTPASASSASLALASGSKERQRIISSTVIRAGRGCSERFLPPWRGPLRPAERTEPDLPFRFGLQQGGARVGGQRPLRRRGTAHFKPNGPSESR